MSATATAAQTEPTAPTAPHTCDGCLDRREVLVRAGLVTMGVAAAGVLAAFIMVFGVILTVMLPELPLRNVSGIQGRFDDDAASAAGVTAVGGVAAVVADEAAVDRAERVGSEHPGTGAPPR